MLQADQHLVVDLETVGTPQEFDMLVVGWQMLGGESGVDPVEEVPQRVWDWLADPSIPTIEHTTYDARFLRLAGYTVAGPVIDTGVLAMLLDENQSFKLEDLAKRYLHLEMDKRITASGTKFRCDDGALVPLIDAPWEQLREYCRRDVAATGELFIELRDLLEKHGWVDRYETIEGPLTSVLVDMETNGMPIDVEATRALGAEMTVQTDRLELELRGKTLPPAFNFNSSDQVAKLIHAKGEFGVKDRLEIQTDEEGEIILPSDFAVEKVGRKWVYGTWAVEGLGLPITAWTDGKDPQPKTDARTLLSNVQTATHPWVAQFLEWKKLDKLTGTYVYKLPEIAVNGRIYGRFNQTGTVTGRLSSSEPNMQNMPSRGMYGPAIRSLFCAEEGKWLVIGDYSQLEPRIMAHMSQDPELLDIYRGGHDIYIRTAEAVFGHPVSKGDVERDVAKTLMLAMGYGAAARKIAETLCLNGFPTTVREAGHYLGALRELYPMYFEWRDSIIEHARQTGYIETLMGRHRRLAHQFGDDFNWKQIGYGERQAGNAVIQGSAADVVGTMMIRVSREMPLLLPLAQVHDEMVWEIDEDVYEPKMLLQLRRIAADVELSVPLKFEVVAGRSWADKK